MHSTKKTARLAGLLYLLFSIPGFFGLMYVPSTIIVSGDAAATLHNIATSETLFRSGIAANLVGVSGFLVVAFVLYHLFKGVNRTLAVLMVVLIGLSIPISFLNELNHTALITLARATGPVAALGTARAEGLAALFLAQYHDGIVLSEIFWGLWLFPMGLLVIKSDFLPTTLGVVLIAAGLGWVIQSCGGLLSPTLGSAVSRYTSVLTAGELPFMFWLLIMGAKDRPL